MDSENYDLVKANANGMTDPNIIPLTKDEVRFYKRLRQIIDKQAKVKETQKLTKPIRPFRRPNRKVAMRGSRPHVLIKRLAQSSAVAAAILIVWITWGAIVPKPDPKKHADQNNNIITNTEPIQGQPEVQGPLDKPNLVQQHENLGLALRTLTSTPPEAYRKTSPPAKLLENLLTAVDTFASSSTIDSSDQAVSLLKSKLQNLLVTYGDITDNHFDRLTAFLIRAENPDNHVQNILFDATLMIMRSAEFSLIPLRTTQWDSVYRNAQELLASGLDDDPIIAEFLLRARRSQDTLGVMIPISSDYIEKITKNKTSSNFIMPQPWHRIYELTNSKKVEVAVIIDVDYQRYKDDYKNRVFINPVIDEFRKNGIGVLPYIKIESYVHTPIYNTNTVARNYSSEVRDLARAFPKITGFYFDDTVTNNKFLSYYVDLFSLCRDNIPNAFIVSSSEELGDEQFVRYSTANVVFFKKLDFQTAPPYWFAKFDPSTFASLISSRQARKLSSDPFTLSAQHHMKWIVFDRPGWQADRKTDESFDTIMFSDIEFINALNGCIKSGKIAPGHL